MRFWCLGSIIKYRSINKIAMTTTNATNFGFRATGDKFHRPRASGRRFLFGTHRNKYEHTKASNPCKSPKVRKLMLKGFSTFKCRLTDRCTDCIQRLCFCLAPLHLSHADLIARCYNFLLALKSWSSSSRFRAKGQIGEQFEQRFKGCNKQVFLKNFDTLLIPFNF